MPTTTTFDTRQSRIGRPLNEDELHLLKHVTMWGSDGYPVHKLGSRWTWDFGSLAAPVLYPTKRAAVAAFEAFYDVLVDASGEEARDRALAELTHRQAVMSEEG